MNFSGAPAVTAVDRVIDFNSGTGIRPGLNVDGTSMRWSGEVFLPSAGNYTFAIRAAGPQRLFVNGNLLINDFAAPSNLERTGVFTAAAPGWVSIVFEAVDDTSTTQPRLRWSRPGDGTLLTNITGGYLRTSATPLNQASDDNFRLQSAVASYKPTGPTTGSWSADLSTSPAIDAGNPTDQVFEDSPINLVGPLTQQDGDRVDLGAYGNSNSASRSAANIVQILSPDGGEKARADRTFSIRWRSVSAGQRVNIEFSPNNGATWTTIGTNELNDGVFAWTPTAANQTLQGLIRITSTTIPSATDTSVDVFTVGTSGTNYYVNNNSTTGDQYTTTTGSNLNTGTTPADPMSSLNALLAAYDINPGDIIYVDAGTYNQPSTIQLLSQDAGATILGPTGANVAIINRGNVSTDVAAMRVNANDVTIRNLQFTGGYIGLWGVNAQRLLLEDVTAFNNANVGVQIDISSSNLVARRIVSYGTTASVNTDQNYDMFIEGANALVENSQFYKVGTRSGYGFRAQGNATGLLLRNNLAYNNDAGLSVDVAQFTVHSNEVRGNNVGMETRDNADVDRSEVYNNYIHDNATGATVYERIIFRNNNVTLNTTAGINGLQYGSSIIRDNLISLNGDGIINRYHTILNNRIVGNTNRGILIDQNSNSIIEGNQILGSSVGIRIQNTNSASTNLIINNLIYDNTNQAVDLDYSATTNSTFRLINNTIYHQVGSAVRIVNAITGSQMVNNNIAIGGGFGVELSGTIGAWLSNYNNVWLINSGSAQYGRFQGTPQNTIVNWRTATSQDANSKSADALFIDFNGADNLLGWDRLSPSDPFQDFGIDDNLRVLASSPVIDSADSTLAPALDADGLARVDDLGTINQGNGVFRFYDIGAYEFQGSGNDTTPPVITNLAPVGNVNDVIVTTAVPSFTVTFSERMDPTSVRSLALYRLIEAGVDGNFDTGDDVPFTVSGVSYTFGSLTATINLPSTLPDGYYRLRITSDVGNAPVDLAGNRLDGDNNGTQGGDFNRRFRVDRTGPTVLSVTPNTAVQVGPTSFVIQLAAATDLNVASILNTANYTLLKSIDRTFGNGDDTNVSSRIININFNAPLFRVTLTLNAALEQANYRLVLGAGIVDNVGNPLTGAPYNSDLSVDSTRPTPTLASPFSSGVTGADFGYVDINWNDGNGSGINTALLVPAAITVTGVTVLTATDLGGGTVRYGYTGSLTQGTVTVNAAANAVTDRAGNTSLATTVGSFIFDTTAPTGALLSPLNGSTITNNPGFVDIRWQDNPGSGINAATIDASDITITGVTVTGVTNQGGGVFRYSYSGTLPFSNISVNVVANQVRDNANRAVAAGVLGTFTRIVPGPRVTSASVDDAAKSLTINFSGTPSNIQTLINNGQITTAIRLFTATGTQITLTANRFTWNAATQRLVINLRANQADPFSPSILTTPGQYQLRFTTASITDSSGNQLVDTDGTSDGTLNRNFYWTNSSGDIGPA
ncbi:MAG: right-handed parallel beta-helix repeat-containing protein [Phycisphaerales bacterium]